MRFAKTRFALKTLRHKYWVFRFGLLSKAPLWRLMVHDWTKFLPPELPAYADHFFGEARSQVELAQAWNHHYKANQHHWEYWIPVTSHNRSSLPPGVPLPMAAGAVREMVADWLGATRSSSGRTPRSLAEWTWYISARPTMVLHPDTSALLDTVLAETFERLDARRNKLS